MSKHILLLSRIVLVTFFQNAIHSQAFIVDITDVIINFKTVGFERIIIRFPTILKHVWTFDGNFDFRSTAAYTCTLKA